MPLPGASSLSIGGVRSGGGGGSGGRFGGTPLYRSDFPGGNLLPRIGDYFGLLGYLGELGRTEYMQVLSMELDRYPYISTGTLAAIAVGASDNANGLPVDDLIPLAGKVYFIVPVAVPVDVVGAVEAVSQIAGGIAGTAKGANRRWVGSVAGGAAAGASVFRESLELQMYFPGAQNARWTVDAGAAGAAGDVGTFGWLDWTSSPPESPSGAFMVAVGDDAKAGDLKVKLTNPTGNVPGVSLPGYAEFLVGRAQIRRLGPKRTSVPFAGQIPVFPERAPVSMQSAQQPQG